MKKTALFFALGLISAYGFSQSLEGGWKGYYLMDNIEIFKTEIFITINKINNDTIEGVCTTIKKNDTSICTLKGGFLKKNKLYLEETSFIRNYSKYNTNVCFQRFELIYKENKKGIKLDGNYTTKTCGSGTIFLTKRL